MSPTRLIDRPAAPKAGFEFTGRMMLACCVGFFGIIGITNAIMITLAVTTLPGTVTDSSYRSGQAFKAEAAVFEAQRQRGWQVLADVAREAGEGVAIIVAVSGPDGQAVTGLTMQARFGRPADGRTDRELRLAEIAPGRFRAAFAEPGAGVFDLELNATREGARVYRAQNRVRLAAVEARP